MVPLRDVFFRTVPFRDGSSSLRFLLRTLGVFDTIKRGMVKFVTQENCTFGNLQQPIPNAIVL